MSTPQSRETEDVAKAMGQSLLVTRILFLGAIVVMPILFSRFGNSFPWHVELGLALWLAATYVSGHQLKNAGSLAGLRSTYFRFCLAEVFAVSCLVHWLGTVELAAAFLYLVPVLHASFYLRRGQGVLLALIASGLYSLLAGLEYAGIADHHSILLEPTGLHRSLEFVILSASVMALTCLLTTGLVLRTYVRVVRRKAEQIEMLSLELQRVMRDEKLQRARAETDPVTGLLSQSRANERLSDEAERSRRGGHQFAVLMIDVDNFRVMNDMFGPRRADEVLRTIGQTLQMSCRSTDIVGRCSGDEFILILPETKRQQAQWVAEKVRLKISSLHSEQAAHVPVKVTVSVGVASYPYDSSLPQELVSLASTAVRQSKESGGDMVTVWDSAEIEGMGSQNSSFGVLEGLMSAIDSRDGYAKAHAESVAHYSLLMAGKLKLPEKTRRALRLAALLHDVGKIGIPEHILLKAEPLDEQELEAVRQHPLLSELVISQVPHLAEVSDSVRHHHERWDGTGYPRGLRGISIPLLSRIIAVADAYAAMLAERPYRRARRPDEAVDELRRLSGTQFDPNLVDVFLESLRELDLQEEGIRLLSFPGRRRSHHAG